MGESDKTETPGADTAPGVDYQDGRRSQRYVGGGPRGGQNWANEGYGANQSASAGDGYSSTPAHEGGRSMPAYAVSPDDLNVEEYDLQGGYGQPAQPPARGKGSGEKA